MNALGGLHGPAGKRHAMVSALKQAIEVKDSTLVVQYEVKASNGFACDGKPRVAALARRSETCP
jgi:hypothetical protein